MEDPRGEGKKYGFERLPKRVRSCAYVCVVGVSACVRAHVRLWARVRPQVQNLRAACLMLCTTCSVLCDTCCVPCAVRVRICVCVRVRACAWKCLCARFQ